MTKHPNATVAVGSGGAAVLLVYLAGLFGLDVPAEVAAAASGLLAGAVLLIGRDGVRGIARTFWRGKRE
jgi:hypothetical protein